MTLTFRFRGWNSTARNVCAECHRYTGVSREAPWEMTAVRIPTVVLPEIPAVPTSTFNHTRIHTHHTCYCYRAYVEQTAIELKIDRFWRIICISSKYKPVWWQIRIWERKHSGFPSDDRTWQKALLIKTSIPGENIYFWGMYNTSELVTYSAYTYNSGW